jgi:ATP:corrinoid adenosyltransferase
MAKGSGNSNENNILLNIGVTGQEEVQSAQKQVKNLNDTAQAGAKVNMAAPVQTLRQELRNANNELQRLVVSGQQNTKAYADAARRVAEIRDQIQETNNTIKAFDPDNKFRVLGNAATAGAKAVQGYAGAMAFLGVESGTATETLAKLQGIMAFSDAIGSINDLKDTWKDIGRVLGITKVATQEQTAAVEVNTTVTAENSVVAEGAAVATGAQAVAMEGSTVATEAATVATTGFGTALKAIGIGLIISALAYLISNWDKVKTAVEKLFPSLGKTGGLFKEISQVVFGVGNAILQYLITPIKILIDVIQGDFGAALNDLKSGMDVVSNYKAGALSKAKEQAEEERKERIKKEIEGNERIIKERKALGESTYQLLLIKMIKTIKRIELMLNLN